MMKIQARQLGAFLLAGLLGAGSSLPALADDTEIYVGGNSLSTVRPNVVFIIDTSGSMSTNVAVTAAPYDPSQTYTGSCTSDKVYWTDSGSPPSCGTSQWFYATANTCADSYSALAAGGSGLYVGKLARYRVRSRNRSYWTSFSSSIHDQFVECEADFGIHGDGADATKLYPANERNGGPWRADTNGAVGWASTGRNYTLYSANYLNYRESPAGSTTKTRLEIVQEVFNSLIDSTSGINAAVMRFDARNQEYNKGGYFLLPMTELKDTNRQTFKDTVNALTTGGYTPLAETLYEAARYYRGEGVKFGNSTTPGVNHTGVLDPSNSNLYQTPITEQCQKNFVVLLTDGDPTYDSDADNDIKALPGLTSIAGSCGFSSDDCLDELAHYMYAKDQLDKVGDPIGEQNVITYTIGFATNQALLSDAASKGGGKYYTADDTAGLTDAFTDIITEILSINDTFIAPAVTVNAFNRLAHRDELYFALFRPSERPAWAGNVKRYRLAGEVVDVNGNTAVDPNTGFFYTTAKSWWLTGTTPDGADVKLGGVAGQLDLNRKVYSDIVDGTLTSTANRVIETNPQLTKTLLGIGSQTDAYREDLVKWARGVDVNDDDEDGDTTDARQEMGDPLHSKPVLITYGGTDTNPDITLYVGTNQGYLHAIDTATGKEFFSFIPQESLKNLDTFYTNSAATPHPYGLDGPITAWTSQGGRHYVIIGMRRGGRNYYALDVTDRNAPTLAWQISGGSGDFGDLGQSWSRPVPAKVNMGGTTKDVFIFGGGYDTTQDSAVTRTPDTLGNTIYIVDAATGNRLWWASGSGSGADLELPGMDYGIPSNVTVADVNDDGVADRLYVGDMGGQVWRIDIPSGGTWQGGLLASLGGATAADNRRFYYAPDVVKALDVDGLPYLAVNIGSGYRAHPLDKAIEDRFYSIRDHSVYDIPASYPNYTEANNDFYDATTDLIDSQAKIDTLKVQHGWYIKMLTNGVWNGEKVLAEAITLDYQLMFTTFTPVLNTGASACAPSQGLAKVYLVDLYTGNPVQNLDQIGDDTALTLADREWDLTRGGIPPEITILFPSDGGDPTALVGPEQLKDFQFQIPIERQYWERLDSGPNDPMPPAP